MWMRDYQLPKVFLGKGFSESLMGVNGGIKVPNLQRKAFKILMLERMELSDMYDMFFFQMMAINTYNDNPMLYM